MSGLGIARFGPDGRLVSANAAFGARLQEAGIDGMGAAGPGQEAPLLADLLERLMPGGGPEPASAKRLTAGEAIDLPGPWGCLRLALAEDGAEGHVLCVLPGPGDSRSDGDGAEDAQREILDAIAFPMVVTRLSDGMALMANQPASEFFGIPWDTGRARARAPDVYVDPADRARMLVELEMSGGRLDAFETRLRAAGGREAWVLLSVRVFRYRGEDALLACVNDITERKRMEQALADNRDLLQMALQAARDGISYWDVDTGEIWFSPQWWALLGYGEGEMVNTVERWSDLILPEDREPSLRLARDFIDGIVDTCQIVQRFRHKNGHVVHLYTRAMRVTDGAGRTHRLVGSHTDITERVRAEAEVRAAKEQAERALRRFQEAQVHLVQTEKMAALGSLVAGVAHEINTPLGIALTGASLLAERTGGIRTAFDTGRLRKQDFAEYVDTAEEASQLLLLNVQRAAQLIQSFKQIAVDQASEERRAFDLKDYIQETLRSLHMRIRKTGHEVEVECPDDLIVDSYPGALSQVLTNFIINSLTHAYAPGQAGRITIRVSEPAPDEVELSYADDGKGIPQDLHARVFEPFFTTNRASGGSGLGLNIVYNVVTRNLKGRLTLSSAPGRGTTFTLRFPRVAPAEADGR